MRGYHSQGHEILAKHLMSSDNKEEAAAAAKKARRKAKMWSADRFILLKYIPKARTTVIISHLDILRHKNLVPLYFVFILILRFNSSKLETDQCFTGQVVDCEHVSQEIRQKNFLSLKIRFLYVFHVWRTRRFQRTKSKIWLPAIFGHIKQYKPGN